MLSSCCVCVSFFFFQAEDGIRDLVRSRGLGDVYKRQVREPLHAVLPRAARHVGAVLRGERNEMDRSSHRPVSYTHLTLPTSDLV